MAYVQSHYNETMKELRYAIKSERANPNKSVYHVVSASHKTKTADNQK